MISAPPRHLPLRSTLPPLAAVFALAVISNAQETLVLDPSWAYPSASADTAAPGFSGKIHQARQNSGLSATIARGNAQLRDELTDPQTNQPYTNLVVDTDNPDAGGGFWFGTTPADPGGSFTHDGVINFTADDFGEALTEAGNFDSFIGAEYADLYFPGLPGATDDTFFDYSNGQNFAVEFVAYLDLPLGQTTIGVYHDDAMELAFHPNDARDIFRSQAVGFDSNSVATDRTVTVVTTQAGLYPVRLLLAQWVGTTALELYTVDPLDPFLLTLVNDPLQPGSINAYRSITTPVRPHVTAVSPPLNATGVEGNTSIAVTLENLAGATPVMRVEGAQVTYTTAAAGTATTLTHTPTTPFASGQVVDVELDYGNATAAWSFVVKTGSKALLITGGGQLNAADGWVANRLATQFGLDVTVVSDGTTTVADADGAALIFNSSTVNSGLVANDDFETLPIPLINVESANVDDFILTDGPHNGKFGNNPSDDEIFIEDPDHPLAAGLPFGLNQFATGNVQFHRSIPGANAILVATAPNFPDRGVIFAYEKGASVLENDGFTEFIHPARRIHFGHTGNEGAAMYNANGVALFDAAITWALADPDSGPQEPFLITDITYDTITRTASITFTSAADKTYRLYASPDLKTWTEIDDRTATGDTTTIDDPEPGPFTIRHYRVERTD